MELVNAMYAHKDKAEFVNAAFANELTHNLVLLFSSIRTTYYRRVVA